MGLCVTGEYLGCKKLFTLLYEPFSNFKGRNPRLACTVFHTHTGRVSVGRSWFISCTNGIALKPSRVLMLRAVPEGTVWLASFNWE